MLYHDREHKNKENVNFVHILYLLAKLCNIFDEAFLLTSVYNCQKFQLSISPVAENTSRTLLLRSENVDKC